MITLKTLAYATKEEVFNQVAAHLLNQGKKSMGAGALEDTCRYRGEGGTKCAAGCLISDEEYCKDMEQTTWSGLRIDGRVPDTHSQLIQDLQLVHDLRDVESWGVELKEVAQRHGIVLPQQKCGE